MTPLPTTGELSTSAGLSTGAGGVRRGAGPWGHVRNGRETTGGRAARAAAGDGGGPARVGGVGERGRCSGSAGGCWAGGSGGSQAGGGGRSGADGGPLLAGGGTSAGAARLGAAADGVRPRAPGRGPGGAAGRSGTGGGGRPGVLRGPGGGTGCGVRRAGGYGHPSAADDLRAGARRGEKGRRSGCGRGARHGGADGTGRRLALRDGVPALGPAERGGVSEPPPAPPAPATEPGPAEAAAGTGRADAPGGVSSIGPDQGGVAGGGGALRAVQPVGERRLAEEGADAEHRRPTTTR